MGIKEKRHPKGMIDLTIVPMSMTVDETTRIILNQYMKAQGYAEIPEGHHVLIVDMGECE